MLPIILLHTYTPAWGERIPRYKQNLLPALGIVDDHEEVRGRTGKGAKDLK